MQGLGHVGENTQPVALLSSLSVTPYNPPFKEMSSFMVPSTHSKSTPLRSLQLKHTTKPRQPISDVLFSQSVPPSISLIVCLSFSEKKPTCVSTLSWHGCLSPAAQARGSHKAGHLKRLRSAGYVAFGVWPPSWELPSGELWLNATYPGRQIESMCERESGC